MPQVKKQLKGGPIFTPDGFISAIKSARKNNITYSVNELTYQDFFDIKDLANSIGPVNTTTMKISEVKIMKIEREKENVVSVKYSFKDDTFVEQLVVKKKKNFNNIKLKPIFGTKPGIATNKKDDLLSLLDNGFIPKFYEHFYRSL